MKRLICSSINISRPIIFCLWLFGVGLFLLTDFAQAQSTLDAKKLKQLVLTQQEKYGCAGIWDVLWPEAKKGNEEAKAMLAGSMLLLRLNPPGQSEDVITQLRNIFILMVHGGPLRDDFNLLEGSKNGYLKEMLRARMNSVLAFQPFGKQFLNCLDKTKKPASCINKMVERRIVPSFEKYAREIDDEARMGAKAKCLPLPFSPAKLKRMN